MNIKQSFKNNRTWVEDKLQLDQDYFENLSKGQNPEILYIGCSDSRVTAEEMMGASPGDLFVHRNIANMIINTDLSSMSVINYAVSHLKVGHIVICGHYYCGGVKAAMQSADLGILNLWLREIKDVYRLHSEELNEMSDEEARYKRLVQLNVEEQCINVLKIPEVQKARREKALEVHGWVFDLRTGQLVDLKIKVDEIDEDIISVYRVR